MILLLINIGNTNTTVAGFSGGRVVRRVRMSTADGPGSALEAAIRQALGRGIPAGAVVGSTVPARVSAWRRALKRCGFPGAPLEVSPALDPGFPVPYAGRASLGADRLADVCGGVARYGRPLIVVDIGTAATVNVVTRKGFVGGVILPGPSLFLRAMADGTAQLPRLRPGPPAARRIGRTTEESMRIGATAGFSAMLSGLIRDVRREAGGARIPVVITGGGAARMKLDVAAPLWHDADLTFFGLAGLYALNRPDRGKKRVPVVVSRRIIIKRKRPQDEP